MYDGLKALEVPRPARKHPGARRFARAGLVLLAVFSLFVAGTGIYIYNKVTNALEKTHRKYPTDKPFPDQPMNVLVVGSDTRDVVSKRDRRAHPELGGPSGQRADTMILIHISANAERAVAISFPRDLRVEIPGNGVGKLNAAYAIGGGRLTMRTIRSFSGLPIHHYVEVNFNSFRAIVDAVGEVDMCVTRAYDDEKSGLHIPRPGCYGMDGNLALAFVRARNIDPRADLGRIERQQQFIRALMKRVKSIRFLFNFGRVSKLADAIAEGGLITSQDVDLGVVRNVASKLSSSQKRVDFRVVPNYPQYIGGISYVIARTDEVSALFTAMREDRPLPDFGKTEASVPDPEDVSVAVLNGTGKAGFATRQAERLRKRGFAITTIGNASKRARTLITFNPGGELKADLVARRYPGAIVREVFTEQSSDVVLILGRDLVKPKAEES